MKKEWHELGDLVDLNQRLVKVGTDQVRLTATEYHLLSRLIRENGRVVSQNQLLTDVWGPKSTDQIQYYASTSDNLEKN